ncbi:winged helix-turn-helix transcriptional regulator [Testudinibacter aquarius]|uniref:Winged helix-turn-helix DNA-binding protein n=1 Tax=Testudinibacter aquarius TaxID=1524974 RepID=A0A4R3YB10_9PAST|nr:winged helix-turn-helix transcriptional regulator [Testudinibacter aquarius]KAE9531089.1 hypothetical protein A1D24_05430 [Testudinibacter aquarius]TCV89197.1 winged helix-turn-helix DNA-binding protein [Testudinibacter aquarius]TNG91956.1 winged helix-turn-helix transcriptional regulator [Testudinibacter aquarius]
MPYSPPFQLTHKMISLVASISELLGRWSAGNPNGLVPILRRENRIRTIQASLAVEHNTLTLEQVTAVIEGKTVSDLTADCSTFIEFLLDTLQSALQQAILTEAIPMKTQEKTPEKILLLLQQNPNLTLSEVAKQINRSSSAVERAVAKLKQQGKLTFHGAKKNGAWEVKTKG